MKHRYPVLLILLLFFTSCGYIAVKEPFTLRNTSYESDSHNESSIGVLNWNIHKEGNEESWRADFLHIIEKKKPHIIILQEARLEQKFTHVFDKEIKMGWEFTPNVYQGKYDAYSGVLTASYSRPLSVKSTLSEGLEPITATPKSTLFTTYKLSPSQTELLVVNVHGVNFQVGLADFKEQLHCISETISKYHGPVIMAGDFNTWKDSRVNYLRKITNALGLKQVDFLQERNHIESTFNNPLDYIFYHKSFFTVKVNSPDVLEHIESSDHRPLFVELELIK